jgi:alkaline phosphatase
VHSRTRTTRRAFPAAHRRWLLGSPLVAGLVALPVAVSAAPGTGQEDLEGAGGRDRETVGNMIFIHPDGADAAMWEAARVYWEGPDGNLHWDRLPEVAPYRGHVADQLTATSNGGATVHAFGFKVDGPDSFGTDAGAENPLGGDAAEPRRINGLSGYYGSWLREAGNAGYPIGVVNDGDIAEPGTAAFLAEVEERTEASALELARQQILGRPGFDDADVDPAVIMGGGEALFLPAGTPYCTQEQIDTALGADGDPVATIPTDCLVHRPAGATLAEDYDPAAPGGSRTDGLNLLQAAVDEGYLVIRTRAEFEALREAIEAGEVDPAEVKVLALFADEDIFNDEEEESLIDRGLVDPSVPADAKETNLVLYGSEPGTPGYRPPTAPEMAEVATTILEAHSERVGLPYATVWEVEGTDNFGNIDNAIGTLVEARYADEMIGVARQALGRDPETTILTAADSTAGGMQVYAYNVDEEVPAAVGTVVNNPGIQEDDDDPATPERPTSPLDGRYGAMTEPFFAEPDQFGQQLPFAIAWAGTPDFAGGVVSRAEGLNAEVFDAALTDRFDNVDVYRLAYLTLFGEGLVYPDGQVAPTRPDEFDVDELTPGNPNPDDRSVLSVPGAAEPLQEEPREPGRP